LSEPKEIAIVGRLDSHEVRLLIEEIYTRYIPNKVVVASDPSDKESSAEIKLLEGRTSVDGKATAYVCRNYTCLAPVTEPSELATQLKE